MQIRMQTNTRVCYWNIRFLCGLSLDLVQDIYGTYLKVKIQTRTYAYKFFQQFMSKSRVVQFFFTGEYVDM